ncbi:MAG: hypothetical protein ABFC89_05270 [Methanospirillum sp.]
MALTDPQTLFGFFFAIYFALIIERSNDAYRAWDTYAAWTGRTHSVNRLLAGWLILLLLPVTHFAILFTLLGVFDVTFTESVTGVVRIILISVSSFFSFGYYRLYEATIHSFPETFFAEDEQPERPVEIRPQFWAHFIPGLLYVSVSTLLLLITLYI